MRVLIGDKPQGELTAMQAGGINPVRKEERVEGTVLSADEATRAHIGRTKLLFMILGGIALVVTPGVSLLADPQDQAMILALAIGSSLVAVLVLAFLLCRRVRVWNARLAQHGAGLPPSDTPIVVDSAGLGIAGRTYPWPALRIDQVDLAESSREQGTVYFIECLSLAAGSETIVLDVAMIANGRLIVGNVWRRMRPTA